MTPMLLLRDVVESDLPIFYAQQLDPVANHMAAFTVKDPADRTAFAAHWARILADDTIIVKTIIYGEEVAGSVAGSVSTFVQFGEREVSYWIGREFWGKGIATRALALFLETVTERPLHARAAKDNLGSIRVLQKCGFVITGEDRGFANARGQEIEEYILALSESDG